MRRALDRLYAAALVASAAAIVTIAVLVFIQISGRIIDRALIAFGQEAIGIAVPSLSEIGGFLFVGAGFLALPATLRAAGHVRVTMLAKSLPPAIAHVLTVTILAAGLALAGFAAWHAWLQALDSYRFDSVSFGMIAIPLWLPQGAMTLGLGTFAIALADELLSAIRGEAPAFAHAEASRGIDEGGH